MVALAMGLVAGALGGERAAAQEAPTVTALLERRLEIEIVPAFASIRESSSNQFVTARAIDEGDLAAYTPILVGELGRYPASALRAAGLERVVLCRELRYAGQRRNAVPDFEGRTLYLDVGRGMSHAGYMRRVLHHDLYHMIDLRDDGQLGVDPAWASLNPDGFHYGDGGRNSQDRADTSVLTDAYPGFLNHYATTAVEEDKAETFAWLMTDPDELERRSRVDPILAAKTARVRDQARGLGLRVPPS
jgi:hypothetical protein